MKKPSAGLSKKQRSNVVKMAMAGKDMGMSTPRYKKKMRLALIKLKKMIKSLTIQSVLGLAALSEPTIAAQVMIGLTDIGVPESSQEVIMKGLKAVFFVTAIYGRIREKQTFNR